MISHAEYIELLGLCIGPAIVGMVATLARHTRYGWKGVRHFVASAATSVFVATITGLLLDYSDLPSTVITGIIGLTAYSGGSILDAVLWRFEKEIKTAKIPMLESGGDKEAE